MKQLICILLAFITLNLLATAIPLSEARELAEARLTELYPNHHIASFETLTPATEPLAYVFHLLPRGYMVIGASNELPPLMAYSGTSAFRADDGTNILEELLCHDLTQRLACAADRDANQTAWAEAFNHTRFQQWPPAGYSPTEGWLKTNWTQSAPYNWMVPLDPNNNQRSVAGCPAVAMSMIVNFHAALNGTRLNDNDDYHHQYNGRNYWIDNDFATLGFPSFPVLNTYLDVLNHRFRYEEELSDSLKAALIFATGTALTQVYASDGSGTFGVNQAFAAFQRFNFPEVELLNDAAPDLYSRMEANIKNAQPVHLAVVTPAWDMGHNVVVDGFNTENFYHLNFGWGGQYNGWYLLPSQIPYGLTVVEGAIVDIAPYQYALSVPDTLVFSGTGTQSLELVNLHNGPIVVENLLLAPELNPQEWSITPLQTLPATIAENGLFSATISYNPRSAREPQRSSFRVILDEAAMNIPLRYEPNTAVDDMSAPAALLELQVRPNPFRNVANLSFQMDRTATAELIIYNSRGQLVRSLIASQLSKGEHIINWDGRDDGGRTCASGIYLARLHTADSSISAKLLLLK